MQKERKIRLLKALAFPATAAFSFGIVAADIQADSTEPENQIEDTDATTAAEVSPQPVIEENPTQESLAPTDPVQEGPVQEDQTHLNVTEQTSQKEYIAPADCDPQSGIQGVYLGEWEQIGENRLMLLNPLGFNNPNTIIDLDSPYLVMGTDRNNPNQPAVRVRVPDGETWSYADGIQNGHGATVITDYSDSGYGDAIVPGADYYIERKLLTDTAVNQGAHELDTPVEIRARDILIPGKITLRFVNAATTPDGVLCDAFMVIDQIRLRILDNGLVVQPGTEVELLTGSYDRINAAIYTFEADDPTKDSGGDNIKPLGADFQVNFSVRPTDGSTLADHGADQMLVYFDDIDGMDDMVAQQNKPRPYVGYWDYNGTKAESFRFVSGAKGPVIIYDREVELDNIEQWAPGQPFDPESYQYTNYQRQDPQYFFNGERLTDSNGTWFAGAHITQPATLNEDGEDPQKYTGFITLVDPSNFVFRVAANRWSEAILLQAEFSPKLRVINEGAYPNTITVEDTQVTNQDGQAKYQPKQNPTSVDDSKGPDAKTDSQDYTYRVGWKASKTLKIKAEEGFILSTVKISKGVDGSDEQLETIDLSQVPIGGTYTSPDHPGMVIRRISENEIEMDVVEEYTDPDGTVHKGFMDDHTVKFASVKKMEATPDTSVDYEDVPQTGTPVFTPDPKSIPEGATENKLEKVTLVDENGNEVDTVTVPGEGTYVLNSDGTITFTPEPGYVGKTSGVKVRGYDSNGFSSDTTYTPEVIPTPRYTIVYDANGGTGTMEEDVYKYDEPTMPFKDNTFTNPGKRFVGFKAYITDPETGKETVLKDENGNDLIFTSAADMQKYFDGKPGGTQIRMEAQWVHTVTYVDPATGAIIMGPVDVYNNDADPVPANPTREGFVFVGWKKIDLGDGFFLYEAQWEPIKGEEVRPAPAKSGGVQTSAEGLAGLWTAMTAGSAALASLFKKKKDE